MTLTRGKKGNAGRGPGRINDSHLTPASSRKLLKRMRVARCKLQPPYLGFQNYAFTHLAKLEWNTACNGIHTFRQLGRNTTKLIHRNHETQSRH